MQAQGILYRRNAGVLAPFKYVGAGVSLPACQTPPSCTSQAQCILYRRYAGVLAPFKYAGYPLLLAAVTLPPDEDASAAHFLAPERAPQLQARPLAGCGAMCGAHIT